MPSYLCKTCGTQFPASDEPPARCPICSDDRQYVPDEGQQWVPYDDVRAKHQAEVREEQPRLTGIGLKPEFGIGERALLVESPGGNVLWDCLPLLDELAAFVESRGRSAGNRDLAPEVSFMYSYPMLIPLPPREVEGIAAALEPWQFERIYGAWWGRVVREDAKVLSGAPRSATFAL